MGTSTGIFIALEGIDGAGTTTQARLLEQRIKSQLGHEKVHVTSEPTSFPVGALIRNVLQGRIKGGNTPGAREGFDLRALALLFAADRLDHLSSEIEPLLSAGWIVISDRYVLSSLAYQTLDAPWEWVQEINRFARWPDLTIYLDVGPEVAAQRIRRGRPSRELFETQKRLEQVYRSYQSAISNLGDSVRIARVTGDRPVEEVAEDIWREVSGLLRG